MAQIFPKLRGIARRRLRGERAGHTLTPTALVNEAYVRCGSSEAETELRTDHAVLLISRSMKHVLIDSARRRGRRPEHESLDSEEIAELQHLVTAAIDFDAVLEELRQLDPRHARIVELRKDTDLSVGEIAECVGMSARNYYREWPRIRAWLQARLKDYDVHS